MFTKVPPNSLPLLIPRAQVDSVMEEANAGIKPFLDRLCVAIIDGTCKLKIGELNSERTMIGQFENHKVFMKTTSASRLRAFGIGLSVFVDDIEIHSIIAYPFERAVFNSMTARFGDMQELAKAQELRNLAFRLNFPKVPSVT